MTTITAQNHLTDDTADALESLPVWDRAPDKALQDSIDRVLAHMTAHGISPRLKAAGDVITATSSLAREFLALMPAHLQDDAEIVAQHLIEWVCDYCERTNTRRMNMSFSFIAGVVA